MYGLLLVGIQHFVESFYSIEIWERILNKSNVNCLTFQTHKVYPESFIERLFGALSQETGTDLNELLFHNGLAFVDFTSEHGYEKLLRVHGRDFISFLQNLDNLHEFLRLSYPKIKPPSFFVVSSTDDCIHLEYSTKRQGFVHYVRGQLVTLAKRFYNLDIDVHFVGTHIEGLINHNQYEIYNRQGKGWGNLNLKHEEKPLSFWGNYVAEQEFFGTIAFYLVLTEQMIIKRASESFKRIDPYLENSNFSDKFLLARPYIEPTMEEIKMHHHNTFELVLVCDPSVEKLGERAFSLSQVSCKFKGEMRFVEEWKMILFLGAPLVRDLKQLNEYGLYICDLNMFDRSRDIIMKGGQINDELADLFRVQQEKSQELEKSMKQLNKMSKLTDQLLYQCIPRGVAEKLRSGIPAMETIESFEAVSICFTKVVNFSAKCMHIHVGQVINLLNNMYTLYDALTECHNVYKVETVGDSYMLVSGAPHRTQYHPAHITEMALDILETTEQSLIWPPFVGTVQVSDDIRDEKVKLFIGCHTGPIVAGIIGYKAPRYCLFGDTVNTTSRMMSNGVPNKIHVSASFANALSEFPYDIEYRGEMSIKGKGTMRTYFVSGRKSNFTTIDPMTQEVCSFATLLQEDFESHNPASDMNSSSCTSDRSPKPTNLTQIDEDDTPSEHTSEDSEIEDSLANLDHEDNDEDKKEDEKEEKDDEAEDGEEERIESINKETNLKDGSCHLPTCMTQNPVQSGNEPNRSHSMNLIVSNQSDKDVVLQRTRKYGMVQPNNVSSLMTKVKEDNKIDALLKEAARRLISNPILQHKKIKPHRKDVKFDNSAPDQIECTVFEAELEEPSQAEKGSDETELNDTTELQRQCSPSVRKDSLELASSCLRNQNHKSKQVVSELPVEQRVEKFRRMVRAKMFGAMPKIKFQSSQADIFNEVAEPLSLAITELIIVRPKQPIQYLGDWLWQYSRKTL